MSVPTNATPALAARESLSAWLTWLAWFLGPGSLLLALLMAECGHAWLDDGPLPTIVLPLLFGHAGSAFVHLVLVGLSPRRPEFWLLFVYWGLIGWVVATRPAPQTIGPTLTIVAGIGCFYCSAHMLVKIVAWVRTANPRSAPND